MFFIRFSVSLVLVIHLPQIPSKELPHEFPTTKGPAEDPAKYYGASPKLLVLMIDGFRWDYFERQRVELNTLRQFVSEGVQAEWVVPIFPSLSYPNWLTVSTGLFAESHGIIGNYMLDRGDENRTEAEFILLNSTSTSQPRWWKNIEPIWITATKNNRKTSLANWGRCDVPHDGVSPAHCTGYKYTDVSTQLRENLQNALQRLKQDFSLAMVYDDLLDHAGHAFGPDSYEVRMTLLNIDSVLQEFMFNLRTSHIANQLNVIILSDHGMANIKKDMVKYIFIGDYVNASNIYKVVDFGAISSIAVMPTENSYNEIFTELQSMPEGIDIYKKEEIPEEFHYSNSPMVLDFLLVARPGYAIVGIKGDKQLPNNAKASEAQPYMGNHGYYNLTDMRGVFYARGPAFKKNYVHPPIRMEDEYQIFCSLLDFPPLPHNGSWEKVNGMFEYVDKLI